ncbi:hypothetical protein [Citricoccus sp. I39-566]|uniref:hypothetical protein n=1 Tax=Citricoccus sp. I39-566 TaxID=3073268 RepID=UPI00286A51F7|nr:hypothetical protein [Citricoccus sp. I39-566]WMY80090.1 hypothetical protein RE421_16585 [Citricoccus sp. I39-566]
MSTVNQPPAASAFVPAAKPVKKSAEFVIWGVILSYVVAPLITAITIPNMFTYSLYGGSRLSGGAVVAFLFAGAIALIGVITLLVGVSRALSTVDRLGQAVLVDAHRAQATVASAQGYPTAPEQR